VPKRALSFSRVRQNGASDSRSQRSAAKPSPKPDAVVAAKTAGLKYVCDDGPGIRREMGPLGFKYIGVDGKVIRDADALKRIRALAIPPAWTDVWICPDARGHLQATGRDARGRKQYRYHPQWRACRDDNKYDRMQSFAAALPKIRARTAADLARPGLPRKKVLATVVQLLEKSLIRVGNEEYAKQNKSFGLTTMQDKHVDVKGSTLRFEFRGKSGVRHSVDVNDRRLARIVKQCRDLPGQDLFQYIDDDGHRCDVASGDVNAYLKEISGEDFTAKDFRTWSGTVLAATALREFQKVDSKAQAKKNVLRAIEAVAGLLGNTRTVCRKSYIHPAVIDSYMDGSMLQTLSRRANAATKKVASRLRPDEAAVLALLQQRLAKDAKSRKAA
jgi:DNA topoisomerase I